MAATSENRRTGRLEELAGFVVELAAGRLGTRLTPSTAADEIDAIIVGLNMLAEELQGLTHDLEARVADRTRELASAHRDLERLALYDPLTGLANRHLLARRIAEATARGTSGTSPAVLVLDLDGFKAVNDSFGHPVGDQLLVAVAHRLRGVVRETDTVARLGGDEFAIVVARATDAQVVDIAERVRDTLDAPVVVGGRTCWVAASIGVRFGGAGDTAEEFLRDADLAMYAAKARCRGGVSVFEPEMHRDAMSRTRLADEIRTGLTSEQLVLLYQPIVDVSSSRPVAVEALVRWNHPERGELGPDVFVPVAEDLGLIGTLDRWVLGTALAQLARWRDAGVVGPSFGLHVNMSPIDLRTPRVAEEVIDEILDAGVPTACVTVEISGRRLAGADVPILAAMATFRAAGVRVAVDDFGTGTSSLGLAGSARIDAVKIDGALLRGIDTAPGQRRVAAAVVEVVAAFGLEAVAEGIETAEEARSLSDLGLRLGQGRHWAEPAPPDHVEKLLREP